MLENGEGAPRDLAGAAGWYARAAAQGHAPARAALGELAAEGVAEAAAALRRLNFA